MGEVPNPFASGEPTNKKLLTVPGRVAALPTGSFAEKVGRGLNGAVLPLYEVRSGQSLDNASWLLGDLVASRHLFPGLCHNLLAVLKLSSALRPE